MKTKSYSELIRIPSFIDRYRYLRIDGKVGFETFGFDRYLNQTLYKLREWRALRSHILVRDNGCDLGIEGFDIFGTALIHHLEPITPDDIRRRHPRVLDPDNLISTSMRTHQAIHYGDESLLIIEPIVRTPNDTCPWKR